MNNSEEGPFKCPNLRKFGCFVFFVLRPLQADAHVPDLGGRSHQRSYRIAREKNRHRHAKEDEQ